MGAQHHGFELADQLFKGWERRRHDGLGHKVVFGPHPAQSFGGFFGRFDLGLGESDVEILVGGQVLEERQQPCPRLAKQFKRNGRLARPVLEVRELQGNVIHDLGRIAQVTPRILGLDAQILQGLRGPFGFVIDSCQSLGELGKTHPNLLHGHTRNGGHRRKAGQSRGACPGLLGQVLQGGHRFQCVGHQLLERPHRLDTDGDGKGGLGDLGHLLQGATHGFGVTLQQERTLAQILAEIGRFRCEFDHQGADISHVACLLYARTLCANMALNRATLSWVSSWGWWGFGFSRNGMKSSGLNGPASLARWALANVDATTPDL